MITHAASRKHYYTVLLDSSSPGLFFITGKIHFKWLDSRREKTLAVTKLASLFVPDSDITKVREKF